MDVFVEINLIIVIAAALSGLMRVLKQPLIIGYIITGLIVGPYALGILNSTTVISAFSEFGIALLLFIVGLHLNPRVVKDLGKSALLVGVCQVLLTSLLGYVVAITLGFSGVESLYIGISLSFSSTIIVMKILNDKGDLEKLYGKISTWFLIVQDIAAAFALVAISGSSLGLSIQGTIFQLVLRGGLLALGLYLSYKFFLPIVMDFFASSQEFLFLFSLAWGMGIASLFYTLGLSMEIGALTAGVILSFFPYSYEISAKMRPLRDFFLVLFFVSFGVHLGLGDVKNVLIPALVLSAFVLLVKPIIIIILMKFFGYRNKVNFYSGVTMSQISGFSLVVVSLGVAVGKIGEEVLSVTTLVGLITITISTYLIIYLDEIYSSVSKFTRVFQMEEREKRIDEGTYYDVILFGYNRIGFDFLNVFVRANANFLVIDYNPKTIQLLKRNNTPCVYGDADDASLVENLNLEKSKMIISTIPDFETNEFLITKAKHINPKIIAICVSHNINNSLQLYSLGADYVIMPHFLGGLYASSIVGKYGFSKDKYEDEKFKHVKQLKHRLKLRQEHPNVSKNVPLV